MDNKKFIIFHILGFVSKLIRKLKIPKFICRKYNDYYHSLIKGYLRPYFDKAYNNIKNDKFNNSPKNIVGKNKVIWIFWWQGIQEMPLIVHKCIKSVKHFSNGHQVILITKYNIFKYTNIPNYIYSKLNDHKITFTHFSDIVRFNLLKNCGGLWLDSTIYCTSKINRQFNSLYTCGGYSDPYHFYVSSKWTGFVIGGINTSPIFHFMDSFFKLYWKTHNYLIDYFLIDYGLDYVYKYNIGGFKTYVIRQACKNNPQLHSLQNILNKRYNKKVFNELICNTNLFKLTYKKEFKNHDSFYSKILSN